MKIRATNPEKPKLQSAKFSGPAASFCCYPFRDSLLIGANVDLPTAVDAPIAGVVGASVN